MTPAGTRHLRGALLGAFVLVSLAVAFSLRRPRTAGLSTQRPSGAPASGTTMGGVVLRKFVEGTEKYVVKAQAMTGQEQGKMHLKDVEVTFPYVAQGKPKAATITAEECVYDPDRQRASFRGRVKVRGADDLFLESETLQYLGDLGRAHTDDPVKFRRGSLSGESRGAEYRSEEDALDLPADVFLRIERAGGPPTEVRSGQAAVRRGESAVRFSGGVKVTRGVEYLEADHLKLEMSADFEKIDRAVAIENVTARAGAGALAGGKTPAGGTGARVLACRRLDAWFRENGELRDVTAVKNAELEIRPGAAGPRGIRRVRAHHLTFRFDEEGRLVSLEGGPNAVLTTAPLPRGKRPEGAVTRSVKSESFTVRFDPEKGEVVTADFSIDVEFAEPGRRAWAQTAVLDEAKGTLRLTGAPRLVDEVQGSDLRADGAIEIGTRVQSLAASENVRHNVAGRSGSRGLLSSGPSLFLARYLDYDPASKTARYRENALLRSGKDELRAPLIVLEEPAASRRRLTASGGIASLMHPRSEPGARKASLPVEARASELVWEEAKGEVVYKGDVFVKQGDIQTRSPLATVTLTSDGAAIEKVVAGEPVEVQQGARRASGARGTYVPRDETMVLVGPKVVLLDPQQRTEGRSLTFRAGDDAILVDGREEVRTESVFQRQPSRP
jgi:LPS export ABC transporter protein LptC/lipopolysaccharide transport protein LptA